MQISTLPDINLTVFKTDDLEEAVNFSHALVELRIEYSYHGFGGKDYHFVVDPDGLVQITEKIAEGAIEALMDDE